MLRGLELSDIEKAVGQARAMIESPLENGFPMDHASGTLRLASIDKENGFVKFRKAKNQGLFVGVDGGSAMILDGYTLFSVSGIRTGRAVFIDGKFSPGQTPRPEMRLISLSPSNLEKVYSGYYQDIVGGEPQDIPRTIEEGVGRIRSLMEWQEIILALESMEEGSVLAFDGALWAGIKGSEVLLHRLIDLCREKAIMLCGVSKRSALAYNGMPAIPMIQILGEALNPDSPWYFKLDIEGGQDKLFGEPYVVSLASRSEYVFKVDVSLPDGMEAVDLFERLAGYANDPGYMGYPYPLVKAHNNVAFSRTEIENIRHLMEREAARSGMDMSKWHLSFQNFHEILDRGR